MTDDVYQDALLALLGGALPVIVPDGKGELHLYTLLPADDAAAELMTGELRIDFIVKTASVLYRQLA